MGTYPYPPADEARDPNTYEPASFADVLIEELGLIEARRRVIHGRSTGRLERADLADEDVPDPKTRPQLARVEFRKEKAEAGEADDEDSYLAFTRIKALDLNVTGLAFSGGGIRSATFAVGFLQGLAGLKLLRFFDVLSTVSGGGYAGSWWTTWVRRVGDPINVEYQLDPSRIAQKNADRGPRLTSSAAEIDPKSRLEKQIVDEEPEPVRHLRRYSSYMNPRPGLFSVDTWWIVATYTRNVFINLLVILPFVVSLVLLIRLLVLLYRAVALEMQINLIEVAARSLSIKLAVDELQSLVIPRHGS